MSSDTSVATAASTPETRRWAKALRIEWLGQTVASVCWILSVLVAGIGGAADWLQLLAASAWLTANLAVLIPADD